MCIKPTEKIINGFSTSTVEWMNFCVCFDASNKMPLSMLAFYNENLSSFSISCGCVIYTLLSLLLNS